MKSTIGLQTGMINMFISSTGSYNRIAKDANKTFATFGVLGFLLVLLHLINKGGIYFVVIFSGVLLLIFIIITIKFVIDEYSKNTIVPVWKRYIFILVALFSIYLIEIEFINGIMLIFGLFFLFTALLGIGFISLTTKDSSLDEQSTI